MKSIKEKVNEYVETQAPSAESYEAYAEKKDIADAYEAGATYVLKCFEEIIAGKRVWSTEDIQKIYDCVEQLKGNQ